MLSRMSPGARRAILPGPGRPRRSAGGEPTLASATLAAARLVQLARRCGGQLSERDPSAVRATLGQAFDALEQIEAGLAAAFPPQDPGQIG
jgi:hypothetical protein